MIKTRRQQIWQTSHHLKIDCYLKVTGWSSYLGCFKRGKGYPPNKSLSRAYVPDSDLSGRWYVIYIVFEQ